MNEIIEKMVLLIREHLADIENMGADVDYSEFQTDKKLRKAIEWSIVSAIELCINVGRYIISENALRIPESNREVFEILSENGFISSSVLEKMKLAVGYRNMAIHRYGDIDPNTTFIIMKKHYKDIEAFLKHVIKEF